MTSWHGDTFHVTGPVLSFIYFFYEFVNKKNNLIYSLLLKQLKQGEVTANMWAETHIVSGMSSLETIFATIMTYLCQKGGSIE